MCYSNTHFSIQNQFYVYIEKYKDERFRFIIYNKNVNNMHVHTYKLDPIYDLNIFFMYMWKLCLLISIPYPQVLLALCYLDNILMASMY